MNNSLRMLLSAFLLMILLSCQDKAKEEKQYSPTTQKLVDLVKSDERIKSLLMEAIEKGKKINPDSSTNPAQSLEEYYNFIDHSQTAMPWDVIFCPGQPSIFGRMYQALCYSISSTACRWRRWKAKRCLRIQCNTWSLTAVGW